MNEEVDPLSRSPFPISFPIGLLNYLIWQFRTMYNDDTDSDTKQNILLTPSTTD